MRAWYRWRACASKENVPSGLTTALRWYYYLHVTSQLALDPEIAALADDAQPFVHQLTQALAGAWGFMAMLARGAGVWAEQLRVSSGYMPEPQRRSTAHRLYSSGIRKAPRRATATDRAIAEARAWGLTGGAR